MEVRMHVLAADEDKILQFVCEGFTDVTSGPDGLAGTPDDRLPRDTDQRRDIKLADIDDDAI
jgi:hypothetical protein